MAKKEMTYAQAICNALDQEMERDDNIVQLGEDIGFIGGNFKCTAGLLEKYGDLRVKDTPISEQGFVGMGVGMALTGLRPVIELMTAIRDDDPVIFLEHKMVYNTKFEVEENVDPIPFGKARIAREGKDITIVATSSMVMKSEEAAAKLAKEGIECEIIDLRTIVPLDKETVIESVKKTGKLIVADEDYERCGVGAEIAAAIADDVFYYLDAPCGRVNNPNVPLPFSPALEFPLIPSADKVYDKVKTYFE